MGTVSSSRSAALLAVGVGDAPEPVVQVLNTVETIPVGRFSLARGASRSFLVDLQAVGLGAAQVDATVSGRDTLGNPVHDGAGGPILVEYAEGDASDNGDAIPPPVVTSANDVSNGALDPIVGTVEGDPGATVTVSLASSLVLADDQCLRLMSGEGVKVVGSASVDIGVEGTGAFAMQGSLQPGSYV